VQGRWRSHKPLQQGWLVLPNLAQMFQKPIKINAYIRVHNFAQNAHKVVILLKTLNL